MTQTIEKGARVKVTFEGSYVQNERLGDEHYHRISQGVGHFDALVQTTSQATVEVIAEPEREWQPGDVVVDADGDVMIRSDADGWYAADGHHRDGYAVRPLTLIRAV